MKRNDARMGEIRKFSVELIVRASARLCKKCEEVVEEDSNSRSFENISF